MGSKITKTSAIEKAACQFSYPFFGCQRNTRIAVQNFMKKYGQVPK